MEGLEPIEFIPPSSCYALVNCTTGQVDYILNGTNNGVVLSANVNQYVGRIDLPTGVTIYGCWSIQVSLGCEGFRSDIGLYDIVASGDLTNYCGCPDGYTYVEGTGGLPDSCVKTIPAIPPQVPLSVSVAGGNSLYSEYGPVFYEDISNKIFPLVAGPQNISSPGTAIIQGVNTPIPPSTSPHPLITTAVPSTWPPVLTPPIYLGSTHYIFALRESGGTGIQVNPVSTIPPGDPNYSVWYVNSLNNWLTSKGVNIGAPGSGGNVPVETWIGFTRCVEVTVEQTYCLAIAGNNAIRIFLNDAPIVEINIGDGRLFPLSYIHVFPITLQPGTYQLRGEGLNYSGDGAFAYAIYQGNAAAVAACTTVAQLEALEIFSSRDLVTIPPSNFQTGSDPVYTPSCSEGVISNCGTTIECTLTVPYRPCCYKLKDCITGDTVAQFAYDGTTSFPTLNIPAPDTILAPIAITSINVFETTTFNGCFTLVRENPCDEDWPLQTFEWSIVNNVQTVTDCPTCTGVCVRLTDCAGEQDSIIVEVPNLTDYIGSTINFQITTPVLNGWPTGTYCAQVTSEDECEDAIALQIAGTITEYDSCPECSPACYLLTDCTNSTNTIVTSTDLSDYIDYVITIPGSSTCWIVSEINDCSNSIGSITIVNSYPPTGDFSYKCCFSYGKIQSLDGSITVGTTTTQLTGIGSDVAELISQINAVISPSVGIASVQSIIGLDPTICIIGNQTVNSIVITYTPSIGESPIAAKSCITVPKACSYNNVDQTFPFTGNIAIIIDGTPYPFIGVTVNDPVEFVAYFNSLNKGDFTVVYTETSPGDYNFTIYVTGPYTYGNISIGAGGPIAKLIQIDECFEPVPNCEDCLPPPPPPPPSPVNPRPVKPGYKTPACSPEYTEKVNCTFGEAYYNIMLANRYGLDNCCDIDTQKWSMKKAWLDLEEKKDPGLSTPTPITCYCYEISSIAEDNSFTYITCDGSVTTVLVPEGQTINVCSQSYPKPYCPVEGADYTITQSTQTCESNDDCQPQPPIICNCYYINLSALNPMTVSYTVCGYTYPIQKVLEGKTKHWLCSSTSVVRVSGDEGPIVNLGNCQNTESPCNCKYYRIEVAEVAQVQATLCEGGDPIVFDYSGPDTYYLCLVNVPGNEPIVLYGQATITLEPGPCP